MTKLIEILDEIEQAFFGGLSHLEQKRIGTYPYNISWVKAEGTDKYTLTLELAVAGYDKDSLDITYQDGNLRVTGKMPFVGEKVEFRYKGISQKDFMFTFPISPLYAVDEVTLKNGILRVTFKQNEPNVKKLPIKTE